MAGKLIRSAFLIIDEISTGPSVMYGNGDGTFAPIEPLAVVSKYYDTVTPSDVNNDDDTFATGVVISTATTLPHQKFSLLSLDNMEQIKHT